MLLKCVYVLFSTGRSVPEEKNPRILECVNPHFFRVQSTDACDRSPRVYKMAHCSCLMSSSMQMPTQGCFVEDGVSSPIPLLVMFTISFPSKESFTFLCTALDTATRTHAARSISFRSQMKTTMYTHIWMAGAVFVRHGKGYTQSNMRNVSEVSTRRDNL